jgi:hypothetical protein
VVVTAPAVEVRKGESKVFGRQPRPMWGVFVNGNCMGWYSTKHEADHARPFAVMDYKQMCEALTSKGTAR